MFSPFFSFRVLLEDVQLTFISLRRRVHLKCDAGNMQMALSADSR